jgi:tetratricopeptide (TPR) repeat protein
MKKLFLYHLLIISFGIFSQEKDKNLPKANEAFASKNYSEAESGYRISASNNPNKAISSYNLGNAIYNQKQAGEAKIAFAKAALKAKEHPEKHNIYHNLGNSLMLEKNYAAAVEAYKDALRNNPEDEETRYNLALAKKKDKENPDKNKDKKKDKDKKDDKKEDKKDEPKKEDDKSENKAKPEPSKASEQQLKNLLDAVNNEEKKVQAKVNKGKQKGEPAQTDKDW